MKKWRKWI